MLRGASVPPLHAAICDCVHACWATRPERALVQQCRAFYNMNSIDPDKFHLLPVAQRVREVCATTAGGAARAAAQRFMLFALSDYRRHRRNDDSTMDERTPRLPRRMRIIATDRPRIVGDGVSDENWPKQSVSDI
ncbi:unnamed protein product [Sphagnum balticum]